MMLFTYLTRYFEGNQLLLNFRKLRWQPALFTFADAAVILTLIFYLTRVRLNQKTVSLRWPHFHWNNNAEWVILGSGIKGDSTWRRTTLNCWPFVLDLVTATSVRWNFNLEMRKAESHSGNLRGGGQEDGAARDATWRSVTRRDTQRSSTSADEASGNHRGDFIDPPKGKRAIAQIWTAFIFRRNYLGWRHDEGGPSGGQGHQA